MKLQPTSPSQTAVSPGDTWEQRWHPLREEWVIIAAHRDRRPWTGDTVARSEEVAPAYVPDCYLCPGNTRVHNHRNPQYDGIFVFDNDLPCVAPDSPADLIAPHGIFRNQPARGKARVVCYSPIHNTTLAELPLDQIRAVLECWQRQYRELSALPDVNHVLIFENKGKVVGVSNPHPHNQIYATNFVFNTIAIEIEASGRHWREQRHTLVEDIIAGEKADGRRIITENSSAIAFVPYFARYAYETYVAPKQPHQSIADLSADELADLAAALQNVLVRFDNLWQLSFPYVLVLHQAPTADRRAEGFHFHIEIHPPLRSPSLLKYLAGPEIGGGNFISDTSPEAKAAELHEQSTIHYKAAPRQPSS